MTEQNKISRKVALQEMKDFLGKHKKKEVKKGKWTDDKIEEGFEDCIDAIQEGNLVFKEGLKPVYTLQDPLYQNDENDKLMVKEVNFRARIKEADRMTVMDGLDVSKQQGTYALKMISYISKLGLTDIKHLEKDDYTVISQICSVF